MLKKALSRYALGLGLAAAAPFAAFAQSDAVVTKQYEDGGVYEGTYKDGKQHGQGTYRLPNGYEYSGEWVEGEIRGMGTARFPNGSVYEGEFARASPTAWARSPSPTAAHTKANGPRARSPARASRSTPTACATKAGSATRARRLRPDGEPERLCLRRRVGQRDQGRQGPDRVSRRRGLRGRSRARPARGRRHADHARRADLHRPVGRGRSTAQARSPSPTATSTRARSPPASGRAGKVTYANGDVYEGAFENDQRHGQGTFTGTDGYTYVGQWQNGRIEGTGRVTYPDGSVYEGTFATTSPTAPERSSIRTGTPTRATGSRGDRGRGGPPIRTVWSTRASSRTPRTTARA